VTTDTTLKFYPLTFVEDSPDIVVGRSDIDSYASFPEDGALLLKRLQTGTDPDTAARWYQEQYGEPIDLADFLDTLRDLQFLREGTEDEKVPARYSHFWQLVGKALFSPVAWILYVGIFAYCVSVMIHLPYLRPTYNDVFFSPSLVVIELGLFFCQFPLILFHEYYHVLAGKRLGVSSRLGIGRRLYIVVFETYLTGLWSVPRNKRYLPFLAGMLADLLLFSCFTILASWTYTPTNPYAFPGAFFLAIAFSTLLRFVWQFYFYLQTDIYYVVSNALHCIDLQKTTQAFLWNRWYRIIGRTNKLQDETAWNPRDRQVAPWYALFFGAGYLFTIGTLLLVGLPTTIRILSLVFERIFIRSTFDLTFWDSLIFLLLNLLQMVIFLIIFAHEYLKARAKRQAIRALERASA
jgi:hypothetical protein